MNFRINLQTKIVKELGSRWAARLQVPGVVKLRVVAAFHKTRLQIKVANIVIGCSKTEEDASEVVAIKLSAPVTTTLDKHP